MEMSACPEPRQLAPDGEQEGFSPTNTASSSSAVPFPDYSKVRLDCPATDQLAGAGWLDLTLAPAAAASSPACLNTPFSSNIAINDQLQLRKPNYGCFESANADIGADHSSACSLATTSRMEEWGSSADQQGNHHHHHVREAESVPNVEPRVFGCQFCTRKFYSSQALGGHQNAHKRERSAGRKVPKLPSPFLPPPQGRFAGMVLHGSRGGAGIAGIGGPPSPASLDCNNSPARNLGIKAHSLIHKPSSFRLDTPYKGPSLPQAHHGWSPLMGQQPGVGRCELASTSSNRPTIVGVGKFDNSFGFGRGRVSSPFADDEGFTWQQGAPAAHTNHNTTIATASTDTRINWNRMGSLSAQHHHPFQAAFSLPNSNAMTSVMHAKSSAQQVMKDHAPAPLEAPSSLDLSLRL